MFVIFRGRFKHPTGAALPTSKRGDTYNVANSGRFQPSGVQIQLFKTTFFFVSSFLSVFSWVYERGNDSSSRGDISILYKQLPRRSYERSTLNRRSNRTIRRIHHPRALFLSQFSNQPGPQETRPLNSRKAGPQGVAPCLYCPVAYGRSVNHIHDSP